MDEALLWCVGAFANCKVEDLHQVKGKLNHTSYLRLLQHHTIPYGMQLGGQEFILMQDKDPNHISKLCQKCIKNKDEQHVFQLVSWPAQSADLNPIELVYDEHDQKVRAKQSTRAAHLWQLLQESWEKLSSVYLQVFRKKECQESEAVILAKEVILIKRFL